ncbi:MAG: class I SAM-dependent methyltransferase [Woeseiaceae bacterium]
MKPTYSDRQQTIVNWFDATYRTKGDRYLRPVRAYYIFLELLQSKPGQHLLDVACGLGRLLEAGREYDLRLSGIDISEVAVQRARENVPEARIEVGSAERLPYADASFDLISCIGSLERMLDTAKALAEMRRVGKPDARFCLLVRNSTTSNWKFRRAIWRRRNTGNANAASLEEWSTCFESNGFVVKSVYPDQYPLHKKARWSSLGTRNVDFRRPVSGPLERANEFLFILGKKP